MESRTLHLPLLIEQDEDNVFIISCPTFKGCHSYGYTIPEAMQRIREVLDLCLTEEDLPTTNQFIGFREIEVTV